MPVRTMHPATTGPVLLDIGDDRGALVVYTSQALLGREIELSPVENAARRTHTEVLERRFGDHIAYAGVFDALPAGDYSLWRDVITDEPVRVPAAAIGEVDWRQILDPSSFRLAQPEGSRQAGSRDETLPDAARALLPKRYREAGSANNAPMGAAPLLFAGDGQVAWDSMWTSYCDLALAGGPKHRDTLLEPAPVSAIDVADPEYRRVLAEIERGFRLVTDLPVVPSATPGWVGLQCEDETMARWLLRAVAAENVSVRREGVVLYLPAAPTYRLEKEIKNVVTVVAKTFHYWSEHRADSL